MSVFEHMVEVLSRLSDKPLKSKPKIKHVDRHSADYMRDYMRKRRYRGLTPTSIRDSKT